MIVLMYHAQSYIVCAAMRKLVCWISSENSWYVLLHPFGKIN